MYRLLPVLCLGAALAPASDLGQELNQALTREAAHHWTARRQQVAALKTPAEIRQRQSRFRSWLEQRMGGWPARTPLHARITGRFARDGYRVEHLVYESQPKFYVTANVYIPTNAKAPFPAVVGTAGHSATGKAINTYQSAWIGMAKRGYLVLAFDPPGQGERDEYVNPAGGKSLVSIGTRQHDMAGTQCLLTGSTFARYEAWDGIRAVDYLLTRPDVDPKRLAVAGNSGGGTQSAYLAVVESRLHAAVISCYMTGWEQMWAGAGPQDAEQDFPGFLSDGFDFGDFALAFAPRPVTMLTAIRDFFPIDGARATHAETRRLFDILGAGDRMGFFEYDDPHGWSQPRREATYRWLDKWLTGRDSDGAEPSFATEPESNLNVTRTGQVATSLGGETVRSLNLRRAETQFASRRALKGESVDAFRAAVARLLNVPARAGAPKVESQGDGSLRIETLPGVHVSARLWRPAGEGAHPATLWVDSRGMSASRDRIDELVRQGHVVLAIDCSGWGASAPPAGQGGYSGDWQLAQRAMLVGRPLLGIQVFEILRAFDFLATVSGVDASRIGVAGWANGGVAALHATALEPRIASVSMERSLASYMTLARATTHVNMIGLVVPGVLKEYDLPDLARLVAPRDLVVQSAADASEQPLARDVASREFAPAVAAYGKRGAAAKLRIE